jgi:hypothetical protein
MAFTKPEDVRYWITRMDNFKANLRKRMEEISKQIVCTFALMQKIPVNL